MTRVWGSLAYVHRLDKPRVKRRGKLQDRADMGYVMGPSRYSRSWDIYIPHITTGYIAARHVRCDERRYYAGGRLDPEARGNYSPPEDYIESESDEEAGEEDVEQELPREDPDLAHEEPELPQASDFQPKCNTPGCDRPLHHEGAHSNEVRGWQTPGVPSARLRPRGREGENCDPQRCHDEHESAEGERAQEGATTNAQAPMDAQTEPLRQQQRGDNDNRIEDNDSNEQ